MPEHMIDLSRKPKKEKRDAEVGIDKPFFPLSLFLNEEEISKLSLNGVNISDEMTLTALVRVTSLSARETEKSDKMENMTLSLIEGEIAKPVADKAKVLFGKSK